MITHVPVAAHVTDIGVAGRRCRRCRYLLSLHAQQEKQLVNRKDFPPTLPAPLIEETPLQYRKGKRRAMAGLEVAEERERDASWQRRRDERQAAVNEAVEKEMDKREEEKMLEAEWIADTCWKLRHTQYIISHLDGFGSDRQIVLY
jgi:hypothetical protein